MSLVRPLSPPFSALALATGLRLALVFALASASLAREAHADSPPLHRPQPGSTDAPVAFVAGASLILAGFIAGATLIGTSDSAPSQENAGWLTMEAGFLAAPLVSHALVGAWGRGLAFAAPPAAGLGVTAGIFAGNANTVEHGSIEIQRTIWSFYVAGLLSGVAGVLDATWLVSSRTGVAIAPMMGPGRAGLTLGAAL